MLFQTPPLRNDFATEKRQETSMTQCAKLPKSRLWRSKRLLKMGNWIRITSTFRAYMSTDFWKVLPTRSALKYAFNLAPYSQWVEHKIIYKLHGRPQEFRFGGYHNNSNFPINFSLIRYFSILQRPVRAAEVSHSLQSILRALVNLYCFRTIN